MLPLIRRLSLILPALWAVAAFPAPAEWRKAQSDRFIIYSEGSEADLRKRVRMLHQFDRLVRAPFGLSDAAPARPLNIFLLSGRGGMEAMYPDVPQNVGGWYSATENDVYAALDRRSDGKVLLHEYVHHVMRQNFPIATPAWFTEGVAEFYMTAWIDDRETRVGLPDDGRTLTLNRLPWLPMNRLLTRRALSGNREQMAAFYAQSWLLTHYLLNDPARLKGLEAYLKAVSEGVAPLDAVPQALGMTPEALQVALRTYLANRMHYAVYPTPPLAEVAVSVETLPPSADVLFPLSLRLNYAQRGDDAPRVLARIREVAARWPGDRLANMTLAKAEFAWGTPEAAESALNAVLANDPADVEALRWLARLRQGAAAHAQTASDPETRDLMNGQARVFLARAMSADPNDYRIYLALGRSRRFAANYPNENDLATWREAVDLAPQVPAVRWEAAEAFSRAHQNETAIALLLPLANDPHGGDRAASARARLQALRPDSEAPDQSETTAEPEPEQGPAVAPEPDAG
jgi:tetratricopeptide (TPR) repeat protein